MPDTKFAARVGIVASAIAALILILQILVGIQIGPALANLQSYSPTLVADLFVNSSGKLRGLMALDDAFVIAYLIAFAGLAAATWERRVWAILGLGAGIVTALLDFSENSLTLGLIGVFFAESARSNVIGTNHLLVLNVIGQMKWLGAGVAAASFGAAVWDARILNRAVSILFWLFAALDMVGMIVESAALARVVGMLGLLIAGATFLSRRMQN